MGRALLVLIAGAAGFGLVPASPAEGPASAPAPVLAPPIPLPAPGPMAERRTRFGAGPRGDERIAARRSPSGRRIAVQFHGSGRARARVLVAGCINGRRCAGQQVPVRYECPPDDAEFWFLPTLRPEGADLDATPRHPGAAALRQAVADLRPRITVLYRTGPGARVDAWGPGEAAGRRYARIAGLPFSATPAAGLAAWIQQVRPRSAAITVELPAARMVRLEAQRHAFALQRLAGTRFATPVRAARSTGGALSMLVSTDWWHAAGGGVAGLGEDLAAASFPLRASAGDGCDARTVRRRLARFGTLLAVHDRGDTALGTPYPPRPRHLRLGPLRRVPCLGEAHVIRFSDAGRNVEVIAAFGPDAYRWQRAAALDVVDTLRVHG